MRPGELVEFKDGLFGIKAPDNLGIFLERQKRKKEFFVVLATLKGIREVKPQNITGRRFKATVDETDEAALVARLKQLIADAKGGTLDEKAGSEVELEERKVWETLVQHGTEARSVDAWADLLHQGAASKGDVRRLGEMFERCRRPGVGHFERAGRAEWAPIPVETLKGFTKAMEAIGLLRRRLVRVVTVDDGSGETWERLEGVHPDEVGLDAAERALLGAVGDAMASYVVHDRWVDDVTPPGVSTHTLSGQDWHRGVEHLAVDWTGAAGVTRSSAMVQFLVDTGLRTVQDAIRLVARRRVLATPGFAWTTPPEIEASAQAFPEPSEFLAGRADESSLRRDLRGLETYTIDPPDAKDFDDAVSLIENADGGATLWVHIADVSAYVEKDGRLDRHARERATSVYLPTGVLPMLPSRLSDDLCSLREGRDRLAQSVRIDVDAQGRVVGREPCEAVIRVAKNLNYQQVDAWIEQGKPPFSSLHALAQRMRGRRGGLAIETGELRIRFAEEAAQAVGRREGLLDGTAETGSTDAPSMDPGLSIQIKHSSPATRLIEMFMVAANEAVAEFVDEAGLTVPFRCHPLPERVKAERFQAQALVMGLDISIDLPEDQNAKGDREADEDDGGSLLAQLSSGRIQLGGFAASETIGSKTQDPDDAPAPTEKADLRPAVRGLAQLPPEDREAWLAPFRSALTEVEKIEDDGLRELAYAKVLATLGRAFYTPRNMGHFGLGSASYAHFTSPIRRYPDLVLHRQLRWILRRNAGTKVPEVPPHAPEHMDDLTSHCSIQAEGAERLERGILACCMTFESRRAEWSAGLTGIVNGVTAGGIFLQLPGNLEARLSVRDIPGGPYDVDEYGAMLMRGALPGGRHAVEEVPDVAGLSWRELEDPVTGELREVRLRLGDRVRVQIRERDFVEGRVNVRLSAG